MTEVNTHWLEQRLKDLFPEHLAKPPHVTRPNGEPVPVTNLSRYMAAAYQGVLSDLSKATEGERNNQLNISAFRLGRFVGAGELDENRAAADLERIALNIGLEPGETRRTIRSGLDDGKARPFTLTTNDYRQPAAKSEVDSGTVDGARPSRRLRLQPVSEIELKRRMWLWDYRVPLGEVTLWAGHAGLGKSVAAVWLASEVSQGKLDGELKGQPATVLYVGTEDSWEHTIAPRFHATEADLSKVFRLYAQYDIEDGTAEGIVSLALDMDELRATIIESGAKLVVFDALLSTMTHEDLTRQGVIRRSIEPLSCLAQELEVAMVGVVHFRKEGGTTALHMINGSAEWGQVVRSAIGFACDTKADDGTCVMSLIKTNLAPQDLASVRYRIDSAIVDTPQGKTEVGKFVHIGETTLDVEHLLNADPSKEDNKLDACVTWLLKYLADNGGGANRQDILAAAKETGFSLATLNRAKEKAGVGHDSHGFPRVTTWMSPVVSDTSETTGDETTINPPLTTENGSESVQSSQTPVSELTEALQPCDRCEATPTKVDSGGNRLCRKCAPHLHPEPLWK